MKSRLRHPLTSLRVATLAALAWFAPARASADSTVFQTTFATDTIHADPGTITPTGTNWYILSSKDATPSSVSGAGGFNLTYAAPSTAAGVEGVARFTVSPIALSAVGDSITARATFYTNNVLTLAAGFYDSGGVNPLTTLRNTGLTAAPLSVTTGGTLGWKGYRARLQTGLTTGNIAARPAQTGTTLAQQAHDVVASNTGDFNSPGPISIGSVPASPTAVTLADGFAAEYRLTLRITRSAADALTLSYTIADSGDTVLYSTTGTTTNAGTLPSQITSTFDSFAIGNRNNATVVTDPSILSLSALTITASNSAIARILHQPIDQSWVAGQSGSISVNAAGTAPLAYQWYRNGELIPTGTAATYTVPNVAAGAEGTYHVVVTNAFGTETSVTANVAIAPASAPSFTLHPLTQTVNAGETLTLTALASGAPTPAYQWFKGSDPIPGAIFTTYTIESTATTDAGTYRVVATNNQNFANSNEATVTIHTEAPSIVTHPANVTVNVGQPILLSVAATGYPAPTYQWFKGSDPIPGAIASSYTVASAVTGNNGTYSVVATNPFGVAPGNAATVTVNVVAPSITTPPSSVTTVLGNPATFTVTAAGSEPLSYQWFKGSDPIVGQTSASYTIPVTNGSHAGSYHVVVNNEANLPASSTPATLTLIVAEQTPVLVTDFSTDTINATSPVTTSTSTNWYILSTKNARTCTVGDDPATLDVVETRPLTVTLETGSGSAFMETTALFANSPVTLSEVGSQLRLTTTFTAQNLLNLGFGLYNSGGSLPKQLDFDDNTLPANQRTVLGATGSSAVGSGTQNWVGYRGSLTNLAGSGNVVQTLFTRPAQINTTSNRGQELCVTGSGSVSYGEPAGVSVLATGTPTKIPSSDGPGTMVDNDTYTLVLTVSRSAADEFSISYQIYAGAGTGGTLFRSASALTTATTARPSAVTQGFDAFAIGMRNLGPLAGPVPRFVFSSLRVDYSVPVEAITPSFNTHPASQTVAPGASFTLTASASGSPTPSYQWYKGPDPIQSATGASYTVASATAGHEGDYTVVATNAVGFATSNIATITVGSGASPYDTWASGFGLDPGTTGAPAANPSGDGVVNLVKFVLGGDPTVAGATALPALARTGGNVTFTYDLKVAASAQFTIGAESSTDLAAWTPAVHGEGGVTISSTELDPATDRVVVTLPAPGPRHFVRLRIQPLP